MYPPGLVSLRLVEPVTLPMVVPPASDRTQPAPRAFNIVGMHEYHTECEDLQRFPPGQLHDLLDPDDIHPEDYDGLSTSDDLTEGLKTDDDPEKTETEEEYDTAEE